MKRTIEVSEETYQAIKDQLTDEEKIDFECMNSLIGDKWFFRTVTCYSVGRVTKVVGRFVQLEDASWVADAGRFMDCIKKGNMEEVEPVGTVFVNLDTVVDFFPWKHDLPLEQK